MEFPITATLLDYCVLALAADEDLYGYRLTQRMQDVMEISESTLYPVLRRLKQQRFLETYDAPFQGRNRRYYRITESGRAQLENYRAAWTVFRRRIETLTASKEEHA